MKKTFAFLLVLAGTGAFAQSKPFSIKGNISSWQGSERLALRYTLNGEHLVDTVEALNGKFEVSGTLPEPVQASIGRLSGTGKGPLDNRQFFMDGGSISIEGRDSLRTANLKGPKLTQEGEALYAATNPLLNRMVAVRMAAMKMPEAERKTERFKAMEQEYREVIAKITAARRDFITQNPTSYVSLYTLTQMSGGAIDYPSLSPLYNSLSEPIRQLPLGRQLGEALQVASKTAIGATMPDFSSLDTLRKPLSLYQVVKKGKVTLVDFWASWCAPCRAENPNVVKAFQAFHDKGFNIISVSLDKSEAAWKKAILADGMPWYHVSSLKFWDEPVAKEFGIKGVPDSFLLDAEGKVVARGLRGEALYNKVSELVN